jgi:hypothetical protein
MAPILQYEVPIYAEARGLPPRVAWALRVVAIALGMVAVALPVALHRRMGWAAFALTIGPTVGVVAAVLAGTVRGWTKVFADRLEVDLSCGGRRVWRRRAPWPAVERVDVSRWRPGHGRYTFLGSAQGRVAVLFDGDGVCLRVRDARGLMVGSDDPDRLAAAIDAARAGGGVPPSPAGH